ncbi:MAG: tetratricopeptide repeat protein [Breznakibacter sp.]
MKKYIILIIAAFTLGKATAQDPRLVNANQLYAAGKFAESAQAYEDILKSGVESEALYFNLGNAYYKSGVLPRAILNYERALLLDPDDKDVIYNLDLANSQIADRINDVGHFFLKGWFVDLINKGTSDFWAWTGIAAFIIGLAAFGVFRYSPSTALKRTGFYISIGLLLVVVLAFSFSHQQKDRLANRTEAIVFAPTVNVKSSPDNSGTDLFVIHEGTKVKILETLGSWRKIQLRDGSQGWIPANDFEVI